LGSLSSSRVRVWFYSTHPIGALWVHLLEYGIFGGIINIQGRRGTQKVHHHLLIAEQRVCVLFNDTVRLASPASGVIFSFFHCLPLYYMPLGSFRLLGEEDC
jgi:hypothetical protein